MIPRLTPSRLRAILTVSIALNLFLLAIVGAQRWRVLHMQRMSLPVSSLVEGRAIQDPEGTLQDYLHGLSPQDAAILEGATRARLGEILNARREFTAAIERARVEIARDPVDPAAVRAAIVEARQQRQRFGPVLEGILIDAVPRMSVEGRRTLAQAHRAPAP